MSRTPLALALVAGLAAAPAEARKRPKSTVKTQRTKAPKASKRTKRAEPKKLSSAAVPPRTISSLRGQTSDPVITRDLAALLEKYPSISVRFVCHTDSRGTPEFNLALSKRRVDAVRAMLVETGIDSTRLTHRLPRQVRAVCDRGFEARFRVQPPRRNGVRRLGGARPQGRGAGQRRADRGGAHEAAEVSVAVGSCARRIT